MTNLEALTLTIFGEARGEPIEGKIGVAMVMRNRVKEAYRGATTYVDVCTAHAQFSAWTEEVEQMKAAAIELEGTHLDPTLTLCMQIAAATIAGLLCDNTNNSNHYLTHALYSAADAPSWSKNTRVLATLGAHVFLNVA